MKDYANILIFLAVFISLSERTYASIDFVTNINEKDTLIVLYFGKNQNNMDEYYANNKQALSTIDSLLQHSSERVSEFEWQIKSYASPNRIAIENKHMALLRSESVKEFLQKRYLNIDSSKMKFLSEGEDWAGFRKLVAADQNLPDKEEVLMLIDHYPNDVAKRKELIEKLDRGIPYRYIVQKVLPKLRRSEVRISWKDPGKADAVVEVTGTAIPDSCQKSDSRQVDNREIHESAPVIVLASEEEKEESGRQTILAIKNNLIYDFQFSDDKGYLTTEYKKYVPYEGDIVRSTSGRYNFIGPTKLKVSLVWLLTKRR